MEEGELVAVDLLPATQKQLTQNQHHLTYFRSGSRFDRLFRCRFTFLSFHRCERPYIASGSDGQQILTKPCNYVNPCRFETYQEGDQSKYEVAACGERLLVLNIRLYFASTNEKQRTRKISQRRIVRYDFRSYDENNHMTQHHQRNTPADRVRCPRYSGAVAKKQAFK